jgi:predicted nucleic acid-binding protein
MIFWDTSALIRCYEAGEPSHARAKTLLLREKLHVGSALIRLEAASGIHRRFARDRAMMVPLLRTVDEHLAHFDLSPIGERVLDRGIALIKRHALRAGDAIHLASAILLSKDLGRRQLRFATVDAEQGAAAAAEGLKIIRLV